MTTAFTLIRKVISGEVPLRATLWGVLNTFNRNFKTRNRRFEFERLYAESADPWNYKTSGYEQDKYRHTLSCVQKWRRADTSALEIGCSIGVFSQMLSEHFKDCVAVDISREAIRVARSATTWQKNLQFVRSDLRLLGLDRRFDVIVCAETLYYVDDADVGRVANNLDKHLVSDGIIVSISGVLSNGTELARLDSCERELSRVVGLLHHEIVDDPRRPYRLVVFARPQRRM